MALGRKGARRIVVDGTPYRWRGNWVGREAKPVLPSTVAQAIRLALRKGWTPTAPGSPFHLDSAAPGTG